jgi:hypothetical protein
MKLQLGSHRHQERRETHRSRCSSALHQRCSDLSASCPPQKIRSHDFGQSLGDLWHDCDVMAAARIFLQLIADFVVYLGLLIRRRKAIAAEISFYVGSSHCTKSAKWARGASIARRASRWLCSQSYSTGAMRSLWFNRSRLYFTRSWSKSYQGSWSTVISPDAMSVAFR